MGQVSPSRELGCGSHRVIMRRNEWVAVWLPPLMAFILGCITVEVVPPEETALRTAAPFPQPTWTLLRTTPTSTPTTITTPSPSSGVATEPSISRVFFAEGVTGGSEPVHVATEFPGGTAKVYAFATYTGMSDGLRCQSVWYVDGEEVARTSLEWGFGETGETWVDLLEGEGGLASGRYDWELLLDGQPLARWAFTVGAAPAATWSPMPTGTTPSVQGPRIVFVSLRDRNNELYIMNPDGTGVVRLTNNSDVDYDPPCSPDGRRIAFMSARDGNTEIYVMNTDGSGVTRLTNNAAGDWDPAWSPDGSRIAFVSDRDGNAEIYLMNAAGGALTRLTDNSVGDRWPSWSPDGNRIVLTSPRSGNDELLIKDLVSGGMTSLTDNQANDWDPAWSPDGTRIVFVSNRDGNEEIYVMNPGGGGETRLTNDPAPDISPAWSPDGRRIAFESNRGGNEEIYVMNADGTGLTRLTNNSVSDWDHSWCGR